MSYILLVEDNQDNADMVMRILHAAGYEVKHALRGFKGAQMARDERPDLILMDFELPDVSGQTVTMVIRRQLGSSTPPIIAVTGIITDAAREEARKVGCAAFVGKPFTPDQLLQTIKTLLEQAQITNKAGLM